MNALSGKVRRRTPFMPSKNITLPDIKRKLTPLPTDGSYSILNRTIYDNQLDRKKKKNGRSKMRSQFNKSITANNNIDDDTDDQQFTSNIRSKYEFSDASFYSTVYPKTQIEEGFTVFTVPRVASSVNSIQRQVFKSQLLKLRQLRTSANRRARKLERRGKKLFEKKLRTLRSAPPLFMAPKPADSFIGGNRMATVTSVGEFRVGSKMH